MNKSKNPAISDWIKTARKSKKLTQKDLADSLKISKRSLENYESGVVDVPTATAVRVAEICEFPPPFFGPPSGKQPQNKDFTGNTSVADEGKAVKDKYISLLEQNVEKLDQENKGLEQSTKRLKQEVDKLKEALKKSSKKTKTTKKK